MSIKSKKQREAALKAWETIRKKHKQKRVEGVEKLTNWIPLDKINNIQHPESTAEDSILTWKGNGVVKLFHKTPEDIACGPFWEVRWAYGCPINCSYCYLRGTMKGRMKPSFVRIEETLRCLEEAFLNITKPSIFNSGELCDSLMNPSIMIDIVDFFETQNKHKIYLLSKYGTSNMGFLLETLRSQVICGWSVNCKKVTEKWEQTAAKPEDRIKAANLAWEEGYDTRIRIDPIFPIENWKEHYNKLIEDIISSLHPNRIILGTPRGLWKTINYAEKAGVDMTWTQFFTENSGWGKKISFDKRKEIYKFFYDKLDSLDYPFHRISICKETIKMWEALGLPYKNKQCNCYGNDAFHA